MPQKEPTKSEDESFAKYLAGRPEGSEAGGSQTATLIGVVSRGSKEGVFQLATGGQTIELPVDAVKSHRVIQSLGAQEIVELGVDVGKIPRDMNPAWKSIWMDGTTRKELIKEGFFDGKGAHTDHIVDQIHTFKEPVKDPITDTYTLPKPTFPPGTLAEGVIPDPGTVAGQPGGVAGLGGALMPFVLATPHHAPAGAIATQTGAPSARTAPTVDAVHTAATFDWPHTWKELIKDPIIDYHTIKELVKDPLTDPITWYEGGGGTLAEGVGGWGPGGNPGVWNLPGLMF